MAGASFSDRLVACIGALAGIALTGFVCSHLPLAPHQIPILVAPLGASAVLVFAVPASPLAQPWAVVGGNTISALVGVGIAAAIPNVPLAAGLAVGGAILVMSLLRCLHPPGGAAALTAVIGGAQITEMGYAFAFMPVALNSLLLVVLGWAFHRVSRHSYPHRAADAPAASTGIEMADIDKALAELGETFDVSREDLDSLIRAAERHADARRSTGPRAAAQRSKPAANDRLAPPEKAA